MKEVNIYELKVRKKNVPIWQDVFEVDRLNVSPYIADGNPQHLHIEQEIIPIKEIKIATKRAQELAGEPIYDVDASYIAINEDLERMLTLEWKAKLTQAQAEILRLDNQVKLLQESHSKWWSMPWYKRLWNSVTRA